MLFTRIAIVVKWLLAAFGLAVLLVLAGIAWLRFPEHDYTLVVPPLTELEGELKVRLESHIQVLAGKIGARNLESHPKALADAAAYIEGVWKAGGFAVTRQVVASPRGSSDNLIVDVPGSDASLPEILVGAHYDTFGHSAGANDNATGVAALLELSRFLKPAPLARSVRFVAFTNEEPPEYRTPSMGSVAYAEAFAGRPVAMMMSLETLGFYVKDPDSQRYPWPMGFLYPSVGDFVGFVGDLDSRPLVRELIESFRRVTTFPAGAVSLPDVVDGMGWSDHWAFWKHRVPAVMVTDTAIFRYDYYHLRDDTPNRISYEDLARVVAALERTLRDPAFDPAKPYGFTGR